MAPSFFFLLRTKTVTFWYILQKYSLFIAYAKTVLTKSITNGCINAGSET